MHSISSTVVFGFLQWWCSPVSSRVRFDFLFFLLQTSPASPCLKHVMVRCWSMVVGCVALTGSTAIQTWFVKRGCVAMPLIFRRPPVETQLMGMCTTSAVRATITSWVSARGGTPKPNVRDNWCPFTVQVSHKHWQVFTAGIYHRICRVGCIITLCHLPEGYKIIEL